METCLSPLTLSLTTSVNSLCARSPRAVGCTLSGSLRRSTNASAPHAWPRGLISPACTGKSAAGAEASKLRLGGGGRQRARQLRQQCPPASSSVQGAQLRGRLPRAPCGVSVQASTSAPWWCTRSPAHRRTSRLSAREAPLSAALDSRLSTCAHTRAPQGGTVGAARRSTCQGRLCGVARLVGAPHAKRQRTSRRTTTSSPGTWHSCSSLARRCTEPCARPGGAKRSASQACLSARASPHYSGPRRRRRVLSD